MAVGGVPYRLFGAIGRVREGDPFQEGESAGRLIDFDQGAKRYGVGVVYGEDDPILRVIRQFIRTIGIAGFRLDVADGIAVPKVDSNNATVAVGHKEPVARRHDAVGADATAAWVAARQRSTVGCGYESGERRVGGKL